MPEKYAWKLLTTNNNFTRALLPLLQPTSVPLPNTTPSSLLHYLSAHPLYTSSSHVITSGTEISYGAHIVKGRLAKLERKVSTFSRKIEDLTVFQSKPHPEASEDGLEKLVESMKEADGDSSGDKAKDLKLIYDANTIFDAEDEPMSKLVRTTRSEVTIYEHNVALVIRLRCLT
ncbi:hypothetical protein TL16_g01594 [Triparma laevis f. inornata]|uniref:Uncharacterized protein n=1 Tax=Triparma laevis f. inornata TaxID=1714386 RepID=A0A9W6ZPL3_9STRA|nr:hypothetical protein TL16_g01594 [Triparma laevis f. inornata]